MIKILITTLTIILTLNICLSQDLITKKSGEEIVAKILEVGQTEIKYKKFDFQDGPTFVILKSDVLMIRYENGTKDIFIETNKSTENIDTINNPKAKLRQNISDHRKFKSRICINIVEGSGFKNIPVAKSADGTETSISFGGGSGVELEYAYEFYKHFGLAFDIGVQLSELDIPMSNGSMSFSREFLSVTPSFILPFGRRKIMNLKFGGGIDWIFNAKLKMKLSKITGGIDDNWKYKNALAEHLSIIYELKTGRRFSFNAGFKLYNANFTFDSGGLYYPNGGDLKNADGSGFDIILGANYHFNWIK